MGVDSTLAGLWARILRAGARRPVTMATLLLAGQPWHKRTGHQATARRLHSRRVATVFLGNSQRWARSL